MRRKKRRVRSQMTSRNRNKTSNSNLNFLAKDEMAVNQEVAAEALVIEDEDTSFAGSNGNVSEWEVSNFLSRGVSGEEWMSLIMNIEY